MFCAFGQCEQAPRNHLKARLLSRLFSLDILIRGTQTFTFCTQISNKFIEKNNEKYISHQNVYGRRGEMRFAVRGPFRLSDYKCESGVRE